MVMVSLVVLAFTLAACGGSGSSSGSSGSSSTSASGSSAATVYIDELEGNSNGKDDPALDKFWFSNSQTDQTFTTSYSLSLAAGGTLTLSNHGDDPQMVTITGPSNYSKTLTVQGDATSTVTMPTTTGSYTVNSDPTTSPKRDGARGGTITIG
jgi:hypothetical protein